MPFRFYTDEGALIRGEFDNSDNLQAPFATLGEDGNWHESKDLVPSPYHAVETTRELAQEAAARIAEGDVDLDAAADGEAVEDDDSGDEE